MISSKKNKNKNEKCSWLTAVAKFKEKKYKESTKNKMIWHMQQKVIKYCIKLLSRLSYIY